MVFRKLKFFFVFISHDNRVKFSEFVFNFGKPTARFMELRPEAIRKVLKISVEPKKPFEAVPITQITRELVIKFKKQSEKAISKQRNNKKSKISFCPINASNWSKSDNGSVTHTSSGRN